MDNEERIILKRIRLFINGEPGYEHTVEVVEDALQGEYIFFLDKKLNGRIKGAVPLHTMQNRDYKKLKEIVALIEKETPVKVECFEYPDED